ncbi:hypothetical protein F5B17DRAFT_414937 [Nemania serpens]|nr:hypothetical protein F5B17DRAFT_414937 [Nemania serpens]
MRFYTLVAFFATAGAVSDLKKEEAPLRQGKQAARNAVGSQYWAARPLVARSSSSVYSAPTRGTDMLRANHGGPLIAVLRRDDDDDDDDDSSDSDSDDGEDDDNGHDRLRPNTAAIAGGIVGGVLFLLLLVFLVFWLKIRPRRESRRRRRRKREEKNGEEREEKEDEEEEERRRSDVEESAIYDHAITGRRPLYHPVADLDEPPRYQHVVGVPRAEPEEEEGSLPRDEAEYLAELPSPVDGREPSSLSSALQSDYYSKEDDHGLGPPDMDVHPPVAGRSNSTY